MEYKIEINKKFIITTCIIIILCIASFLAGRFLRFRRIESDSIGAKQQIEQLIREQEELQRKYDEQLELTSRLEVQLDSVGIGIDESIRTVGSIRSEIKQCSDELRGSNQIITELRKRFNQYESRIGELEGDLKRIKESTSK